MEKTTLTRNEELKKLFEGTSFECYQYAGFDNADELIESLQEEIQQDEVIYYSNAMEYLSNNDNSLKESIGIALDMGYELKNVNSELLATLLKQQNLNEELGGLISEIEAIFNN